MGARGVGKSRIERREDTRASLPNRAGDLMDDIISPTYTTSITKKGRHGLLPFGLLA